MNLKYQDQTDVQFFRFKQLVLHIWNIMMKVNTSSHIFPCCCWLHSISLGNSFLKVIQSFNGFSVNLCFTIQILNHYFIPSTTDLLNPFVPSDSFESAIIEACYLRHQMHFRIGEKVIELQQLFPGAIGHLDDLQRKVRIPHIPSNG